MIDDATLSLLGQIGALGLALAVGRFVLRSRTAIGLCAFGGAALAMVAHMLYDGQGAVAMLISVPVIYFLAVLGRPWLPR